LSKNKKNTTRIEELGDTICISTQGKKLIQTEDMEYTSAQRWGLKALGFEDPETSVVVPSRRKVDKK
jgi:hypothetical protein